MRLSVSSAPLSSSSATNALYAAIAATNSVSFMLPSKRAVRVVTAAYRLEGDAFIP